MPSGIFSKLAPIVALAFGAAPTGERKRKSTPPRHAVRKWGRTFKARQRRSR